MSMNEAGGVSRRGFLKGAALAGAAMASMGALAGCNAGQANGNAEDGAGAATETFVECGPRYDEIIWENVNPIDPLDVPASWNDEADVVVIGSGAGGLLSSARLADQGMKVICIEAAARLNGTSMEASTMRTNGGIPSVYGTWGRYSDPYDEEIAFQAAWEDAQYAVNPKLLREFVHEMPNAVEWEISQGVEMVDAYIDAGMDTYMGSICLKGSVFPEGETIDDWGFFPCITGQKPHMDALAELGKSKGVDFRVSTPCTGLVWDGERVVGVRAKTADGDIFIKAGKGVAIHGGDFNANRDMLLLYTPTLGRGAANSIESPDSNGDLHRMCLALGAEMCDLDTFSVRDGTVDTGSREIQYHNMFFADDILSRQPWLNFNAAGNRSFYWYYATPYDAGTGELALCKQALNAPGQRTFAVWDDKWHDLIGTFGSTFGRRYIDDEKAPFPWMDDPSRTPDAMVDHDFEAGVQASIDKGYIKKADTLDELAALLEFDPVRLKELVDEWNALCAAGKGDPENRLPAEHMHPIDTPPYYGSKMGASIQGIGTGIRVNEHLQVLHKDGHPIPGLYAGFHFAGGLSGSARGPHEPLYSCVGTSFCSGWLTAKNILELE